MKKLIKQFNILCCVALALSVSSCSEDALQEFNIKPGTATTVGSGSIAGDIIKTNDQLIIPVSIKLTQAASKAFEVNLVANQDAAGKYILDNKLSATHASAAVNSIMVPNASKVAYGADSAVFNVSITRTEIERYYGKSIVIGYRLTEAGKGNNVDQANASGILVLKVADLISKDDIHYISLTNGGGSIIEAKNQVNYEPSSSGLSIPIGISLASFPGNMFYVDVATNTDTIASLVQKGVLPANTIALAANEFTIENKIQFVSNTKSAPLAIGVPWSVISKHVDKKLAVVVKLTNSTLHVINPEKNYTIILIDSENVIEVDVTNEGQFSVNKDNGGGPNAGEGSLKFIDGDYGSKFLTGSFVGDLQCKLVFPTQQKIGAYTLTSGNDAPGRDPTEWSLEASNDGVTWKTVDYRSNQSFSGRNQTRRFDLDRAEAYTHYRLNILSIGDGSLFQCSEWRMVRFP